jgi:hypothetical protein
MDGFTPMGAAGNPVPQTNVLQNMSSIMGLMQQKKALEIASANSIEAQQKAKETQAAASLLSDPVGNGLLDSEGNPTKDAQSIVMRTMPTTGSERYGDIITAAHKKLQFNTARDALSNAERETVYSVAGGAAAGAKDPEEVKSNLQALVDSKAGTPEQGHYQTIVGTLNEMADHVAKKAKDAGVRDEPGKEPWRTAYINGAKAVLPAGATVGPGSLSAPNPQMVQTHRGLQPVNMSGTSPVPAGALLGQPVQNAPAPGIVTSPAGPLARTTPAGEVIPLVDAGGVNITNPQKVAQVGQAQGINDRVQQALHQANSTVQAQDALSRAKAILESPEAPNTGAGFERVKQFKNFLSTIGIDTSGAEDMNSLTKNLARYEASRATAAGLGSTDAARELAHNGSPGVQLDNKALQGIVNQSIATEKAIAAYAKVQSKTNDPQQMLKNETDFRNLPNVIKAYEYGMSRNPTEANSFLHQHGMTPKEMADARKALKEFEAR